MLQITPTIIESISILYSECENCLKHLNQQSFSYKENQENFSFCKDKLEHYMQQIYVHINLKRTELTSINFYSEINSYFTNKNNHKKVEYHIQHHYEGESELVTDRTILNKYFVIDNCLPIMRLVPMQLANNARKYMPEHSALKVELLTTTHRNYIKLINFGPSCRSYEIDSITCEGVRGSNADGVIGMGIGLSEVDNILSIHKEWLDTTFDIESDDKIVMINSKPHSKFSIEISYSTINSNKEYKYCLDELESKLPMMLIHNSMDITSNLLELCSKTCRINEKNNNLWKGSLYKLRHEVNRVQDVIKLCLYTSNNKSIDNLLGNTCRVSLENIFNATLKNLCTYYFKGIKYDIEGSLKSVDIGSAIYVFIFGISSLILESINPNAVIEVTYELDQVVFQCDEPFNVQDIFDKKSNKDNINTINFYRFEMYNSMIKAWNGEIEINNNKIIIKF